jgi:hypothetical protein
MSTLIIGANGSMGKRYQAIYEWLDYPYWAVDKELSREQILVRAKAADSIIVCTPTITHGELLRDFMPLQKPILCEKPISKDMDELNEILTYAKRKALPFNMVMQYEELLNDKGRDGDAKSEYNYFRHGNDGLVFDCLQIIALANGEIHLDDESPIWTCVINGQKINLSDMDQAYVSMIKKWRGGNMYQDLSWLMEIHENANTLNEELNEQYN